MNSSFFAEGNTRFLWQGIFCFLKKEPVFWCNGEGEQSRVYFKVHLDFISSKHHELRKQGEERPVPQFSSPSPPHLSLAQL